MSTKTTLKAQDYLTYLKWAAGGALFALFGTSFATPLESIALGSALGLTAELAYDFYIISNNPNKNLTGDLLAFNGFFSNKRNWEDNDSLLSSKPINAHEVSPGIVYVKDQSFIMKVDPIALNEKANYYGR